MKLYKRILEENNSFWQKLNTYIFYLNAYGHRFLIKKKRQILNFFQSKILRQTVVSLRCVNNKTPNAGLQLPGIVKNVS